uniref:Phorbol-ester/DAG-type domain-containing protein n=1 Tax=Clastoptera arizonana TaxID=38151 RepID=A0A1B6DL70_9HEMI
MGVFEVIVLVLSSLILGIVITLIIQWYFLNRYIMKLPMAPVNETTEYEPFQLPQSLLNSIKEESFKQEPAGALNYVLQFLFQECRNTNKVRQWFRSRLSIELEELLTRTTTGKLFEAIVLRDLQLGSHFPNILSVQVKDLKLEPVSGFIDELEVCLDLDYSGGFQLSIDANMRLNKTAHVSVKVNQLQGLACLRFTRHPYSHWSFSFYNDPHLQLSVESQFQGRSLPQINSIIASQIRKTLKRKHTLPYYKLRYKPFFIKNDPGAALNDNITCVSSGILEVKVIQVSRISDCIGPVYCSLAVDSMAWVEMVHSQSGSFLTVDATLFKQAGQLGLQFKQEFVADKYQVCIVVESVSLSLTGEVRVGDILVAVDGKRISSLSQVNKYVKQCGERVSLRLERLLRIFTSPSSDDKNIVPSTEGLRNRRSSVEKTDSDSSNSTSISDSPAKTSSHGSPEHRLSVTSEGDSEVPKLQVLTTHDEPYSQVIYFNDTLKFTINSELRYLNVSIWSRGEKNVLLGHISLPLNYFCVPGANNYMDMYSFLPPDPQLINSSTHRLSSHPGFEPCLCYGDILLSTSFTASDVPPSTPHSSLSVPLITQSNNSPHDFERTFFNKATQCGFCFKKIWLKDAFQCRDCSMTCHKKCVGKCSTLTFCGRRTSLQPEIITTSADDPEPVIETKSDQTSLIEGSLFTLQDEGGDEVSTALEQLLSRPYDEELMDVAKSTGRQLFSDLAPTARKQRIDEVMSKLKIVMDAESHNHIKLVKEEQTTCDPALKAKTAFLIGKSEEKMQALTVLMLHCCAGLQDSQDCAQQQDL